jgi:phage-related protein
LRLARGRLKRGSFRSVVDLQTAIDRYLADHARIQTFTWTTPANRILES